MWQVAKKTIKTEVVGTGEKDGEEDIKPGGKTCVYSRDIKSMGLKL